MKKVYLVEIDHRVDGWRLSKVFASMRRAHNYIQERKKTNPNVTYRVVPKELL